MNGMERWKYAFPSLLILADCTGGLLKKAFAPRGGRRRQSGGAARPNGA